MIPAKTTPVLFFHGLVILTHHRQVLRNDMEISLSCSEFDILLYLAQQPGQVFTKTQLFQHLYQDELAVDIDNLIYCLIRSLRKKMEPDPRHPRYIHTVRGVGYKFEALSGK